MKWKNPRYELKEKKEEEESTEKMRKKGGIGAITRMQREIAVENGVEESVFSAINRGIA